MVLIFILHIIIIVEQLGFRCLAQGHFSRVWWGRAKRCSFSPFTVWHRFILHSPCWWGLGARSGVPVQWSWWMWLLMWTSGGWLCLSGLLCWALRSTDIEEKMQQCWRVTSCFSASLVVVNMFLSFWVCMKTVNGLTQLCRNNYCTNIWVFTFLLEAFSLITNYKTKTRH